MLSGALWVRRMALVGLCLDAVLESNAMVLEHLDIEKNMLAKRHNIEIDRDINT